jgi:hypothetical protein
MKGTDKIEGDRSVFSGSNRSNIADGICNLSPKRILARKILTFSAAHLGKWKSEQSSADKG